MRSARIRNSHETADCLDVVEGVETIAAVCQTAPGTSSPGACEIQTDVRCRNRQQRPGIDFTALWDRSAPNPWLLPWLTSAERRAGS